jgi:hypothetical protein
VGLQFARRAQARFVEVVVLALQQINANAKRISSAMLAQTVRHALASQSRTM